MNLIGDTAPKPAARATEDAVAVWVDELISCLPSGRVCFENVIADRLEEAVRSYEVEFRGYLNGQGQRPPLELGTMLVIAFRELAGCKDGRAGRGLRVDALEARFHAARRLMTRRLERADRHFPPSAA